MDRHNLKYIISFLLLILFIGACTESEDISGCPYPDSCNYNPDGTDEDSCWYPDEGCLCEDGEDAISDCAGECGGSAVEDCAGACNGSALEDECGICNGPGESIPENSNINITVAVNPWNLGFIEDQADIIFSDNCLDGYDSNDIPEPPVFGTNWIKAYFHYLDWDTPFGNEFTETCYSRCQMNEFSFIVESNAQGELEIMIDVNDYLIFDFFGDIINGEVEIYESNEMIDFYFDVDNVININSTIQSYETKEFLIKLSFN